MIISAEDLKAVSGLFLYQAANKLGLRKDKLKKLYDKHGIKYKKHSTAVRDESATQEWLEANKHRSVVDQIADLGISLTSFYKYRRKFGIKDRAALVSEAGVRFIKPSYGGCDNCRIIYGQQIYNICNLCQESGGCTLCEFKEGA